MPMVVVKSSLVTDYDSFPRTFPLAYESGGSDSITVGTVIVTAGDTMGSTYRIGFVPSGARIQDVQILNDLISAGVYSLGVYCNTQVGGNFGGTLAAPGAPPLAGAPVIFSSSITVTTARSTWTSVYSPAVLGAGFAVVNSRLRVWELLGLAADPQYSFHVVLTCTTAPISSGNIALQYSYTT